MKTRARRRLLWLALAITMSAGVVAARWRQLHPPPTSRDLAERARLRGAETVSLSVDGRYAQIPVEEFKATLDDFYFFEGAPAASIPPWKARIMLTIWKNGYESPPLAEFRIGPRSTYVSFPHGAQEFKSLHPTTEKRVKALVDKYAEAAQTPR